MERAFLEDNLESVPLDAVARQTIVEATIRGQVVQTRDGWPMLELPGATPVYLDAPLPLATLERLSSESDVKVILFGLGLGNAARNLRQAGVTVAAVFEPDPGIVRQFFEQGPSDLRDLPIALTVDDLELVWNGAVGEASQVQVVDTPGYAQAFGAERSILTDRIRQLLERTVINDQTWRVRGRTWILDILENARFMASAPSAHNLGGAFERVPAFIVGAGPSLAKNVELLKEASTKGIVIAVNSSGRALDRAGVEPHLLACLESIDVSHLIRDLSYIDEVIRVYSLSAHPNLYQTGNGPLLTLFELLPQIAVPFEVLYGRTGIPVCASVSTAAFSLAQRMGCSPIVFVGQDLAYTEGRCYAPGTVYEDSRVKVTGDGKSIEHDWCDTMKLTHQSAPNELAGGQKVEFVRAWGGDGFVPSSSTFNHMRVWFELIASLLQRAERPPRLVNATEGGAHLEGYEELTLRAVLDELPVLHVTRERIMRAAKEGGRTLSEDDIGRFLDEQRIGAERVAQAAEQLARASRIVEKMWTHDDVRLTAQRLREVQQAEADLRELVAKSPWVDAWAWDAVDQALEDGLVAGGQADAVSGLRAEGKLGDAIASAAAELATLLKSRAAALSSDLTQN
jgi:Protein of unknown function DUF115